MQFGQMNSMEVPKHEILKIGTHKSSCCGAHMQLYSIWWIENAAWEQH